MENLSQFCTCTDLKCPCHPTNHDKGCALCIQKNLREKEIPSCFFHDIEDEHIGDYHYEDFADSVNRNCRK